MGEAAGPILTLHTGARSSVTPLLSMSPLAPSASVTAGTNSRVSGRTALPSLRTALASRRTSCDTHRVEGLLMERPGAFRDVYKGAQGTKEADHTLVLEV